MEIKKICSIYLSMMALGALSSRLLPTRCPAVSDLRISARKQRGNIHDPYEVTHHEAQDPL